MKVGEVYTVRIMQVDVVKQRIALNIVLKKHEVAANVKHARSMYNAGSGNVSEQFDDCDEDTIARELSAMSSSSIVKIFTHASSSSPSSSSSSPSPSSTFTSATIFDEILSFLSPSSLHTAALVCHHFHRHIKHAVRRYFTRTQLVCFHSKLTFREDFLGLPLNVEHYDNSGEISYIHPQLDLLSYSAYNSDNVRRGVWKQTFTHFLPLYFDVKHARDLVFHEHIIAELTRMKHERGTTRAFHVSFVLKILPTLMNTMIVAMMRGDTQESIAALSGYTQVYHLFIAFVLKYPELQRMVDDRIAAFCASEHGRSKRACPNLGEVRTYIQHTQLLTAHALHV